MTPEEFKTFVPRALQATEHPNWADLMLFVEQESTKKARMLRQPSIPIETVRYLQGVLAGLEFTQKLPQSLRDDYQNILRDSKDSQEGETDE